MGGRVDTKHLGARRSRVCVVQVSHVFPSLFVMSSESQYVIMVRNTNCGTGVCGVQSWPCNREQITSSLCLRFFSCKVEMITVVAISLGSCAD